MDRSVHERWQRPRRPSLDRSHGPCWPTHAASLLDGGNDRLGGLANRLARARLRAPRHSRRMCLFVASFGLGLGPVVWLLPAELFPMARRAPATATVTCVNWLANFVVGQSFPIIAAAMGPWSFLPFGGVLIAAMIFAWGSVPETRGRTLEEIEQMMVMERD